MDSLVAADLPRRFASVEGQLGLASMRQQLWIAPASSGPSAFPPTTVRIFRYVILTLPGSLLFGGEATKNSFSPEAPLWAASRPALFLFSNIGIMTSFVVSGYAVLSSTTDRARPTNPSEARERWRAFLVMKLRSGW